MNEKEEREKRFVRGFRFPFVLLDRSGAGAVYHDVFRNMAVGFFGVTDGPKRREVLKNNNVSI